MAGADAFAAALSGLTLQECPPKTEERRTEGTVLCTSIFRRHVRAKLINGCSTKVCLPLLHYIGKHAISDAALPGSVSSSASNNSSNKQEKQLYLIVYIFNV